MKDLNGQSNLSELDADDWNQLPKEIENVITSTTLLLNPVVTNQFARAIRDYSGRAHWYIDISDFGIILDGYFLVKTDNIDLIQATDSPLDGQRARFRPGNTNTGPATLVLGGFTGGGPSKDIKTETGAALVGGEITTGADVEVRYDNASGDWFLIGA